MWILNNFYKIYTLIYVKLNSFSFYKFLAKILILNYL